MASKKSRWKRIGLRLVAGAVVVQIVAVATFIAVLLLAEGSHASFFALYLPRLPLLVATLLGLVTAVVTKRRALILVEVALLLVVLFPVMGARVSLAPRGDESIRLATYNVHFGKEGRPALLDELAAMPVDILVVQAGYDSLGDRLRERFPDRQVRQVGEFAIVTRFPVSKVDVPPLLADEVRPMFVRFDLDTPGGPLRVFDTHPYSPRNVLMDRDEDFRVDVARREAQVAAVAEASRLPGPPCIVAGDTNLPNLSAIYRRHLGHLADAFDRVGLGFGYTFPASRPWMRIDRVMGSPEVKFTSVRVGPRGASDHRPVFVNFELASGR